MREKVIIDGDWGGDEMQLASVLLARPDKVEVLGATAVFGNTNQKQAFENGRNVMHFLKATHIPVYPGAEGPSSSEPMKGVEAHGSDGIGNVSLPVSPASREVIHAVDFILDQLRNNDPYTITLTASGPLTNIAEAIRRDPDTMKKAKQIVIMGGCMEDMPAHDMERRRGNMTPDAEFNFYMAPADAQTVMNSGLSITVLPMDCTQQLTLTPMRQDALRQAFLTQPNTKDALLGMMCAAGAFERDQFNLDPVMHDVHCALALLHPELYEMTGKGKISVSTDSTKQGRTEFTPGDGGTIRVAKTLKDPQALFDIFLESITARTIPQRAPGEQTRRG